MNARQPSIFSLHTIWSKNIFLFWKSFLVKTQKELRFIFE
ncbi:hypothetical protein BSM4216_2718 [Bacillus smithii]|nr:hypothetical protein BSM4216_2718 [Bacillus smithii]